MLARLDIFRPVRITLDDIGVGVRTRDLGLLESCRKELHERVDESPFPFWAPGRTPAVAAERGTFLTEPTDDFEPMGDIDELDEQYMAGELARPDGITPRELADLDLHFVHPWAGGPDLDGDGDPDGWYDVPFDCFWFNPHPSWSRLAVASGIHRTSRTQFRFSVTSLMEDAIMGIVVNDTETWAPNRRRTWAANSTCSSSWRSRK